MTTKTENEQISTTRTVKEVVVRWQRPGYSEGEAAFPVTDEGNLRLKHFVKDIRDGGQEPVIVFRTTATTTTEELIEQGV